MMEWFLMIHEPSRPNYLEQQYAIRFQLASDPWQVEPIQQPLEQDQPQIQQEQTDPWPVRPMQEVHEQEHQRQLQQIHQIAWPARQYEGHESIIQNEAKHEYQKWYEQAQSIGMGLHEQGLKSNIQHWLIDYPKLVQHVHFVPWPILPMQDKHKHSELVELINPQLIPHEVKQKLYEQKDPRQALVEYRKISLPLMVRQDDPEHDVRSLILRELRQLWLLRQEQELDERRMPLLANFFYIQNSERTKSEMILLEESVQILFSTWPVPPLQHMPRKVLLRQLKSEHRPEPKEILNLSQYALNVLSPINPLNSSDPMKALSLNRHEIEYFCDVLQNSFDLMHKDVQLSKMYFLYKKLPKMNQFKEHFKTKRHLTIYLYTGEKPRDLNEGHLFLAEDLQKYDRDHDNSHEYIDIKYMDEAMAVFKDLGSLCCNMNSLTVIFDGSQEEKELNPNVLRQLFVEMPLAGLEQFSFIRSTQFEKVYIHIERAQVELLYSLFEDYFTAENMPKLRKLNIWLSNHSFVDVKLDKEHLEYSMNLQAIVPQLDRLTFVGPCANKRQFFAQLKVATRLTHLTLDVSRAFDKPSRIEIVQEGMHFRNHLPDCVLQNVTHLRLYRSVFENLALNPIELIRLFSNLQSLQVHTIYTYGHRTRAMEFFNVPELSRLSELRVHNFRMSNWFDLRFLQYPEVTKLTLCDPKVDSHSTHPNIYFLILNERNFLERFFGLFPNLRQLVIFTISNSGLMNKRFFDKIKQTCIHLESLHICDETIELFDERDFDLS